MGGICPGDVFAGEMLLLENGGKAFLTGRQKDSYPVLLLPTLCFSHKSGEEIVRVEHSCHLSPQQHENESRNNSGLKTV